MCRCTTKTATNSMISCCTELFIGHFFTLDLLTCKYRIIHWHGIISGLVQLLHTHPEHGCVHVLQVRIGASYENSIHFLVLIWGTYPLHGKPDMRIGSRIVWAIPFDRTLQKTWAVVWGEAILLLLRSYILFGYNLWRVVLPPRDIL